MVVVVGLMGLWEERAVAGRGGLLLGGAATVVYIVW